jgi:hypothetical protein
MALYTFKPLFSGMTDLTELEALTVAGLASLSVGSGTRPAHGHLSDIEPITSATFAAPQDSGEGQSQPLSVTQEAPKPKLGRPRKDKSKEPWRPSKSVSDMYVSLALVLRANLPRF